MFKRNHIGTPATRNVILDRNGDYVRFGDTIRYVPAADVKERHNPKGFTEGNLYTVRRCFEWVIGGKKANGVEIRADDTGLIRDVY
jgi:hypothetical protein